MLITEAKPARVINMAKGGKIHKTGTIARLHKGERVLSAAQAKKYERDEKIIRRIKGRKAGKGSVKLTGKTAGDLRYGTHRGEKDFHEGGHDISKKRRPYSRRRRT